MPRTVARAGAQRLPRPALPKWLHQLSWRTALGALLLGGILHVGATLAIPLLGPGAAFQRLRDVLPVNTMVIVPPGRAGKQILPFIKAGAFYAMCRYDLADEPVTVAAPVADAGWALSLHSPQGDNFYVMPAQQSRGSDVSLVIIPGSDKSGDLIPAARRSTPTENQITSPATEGLVVIRAPLKGLAWAGETEALLSRAKCAPSSKF